MWRAHDPNDPVLDPNHPDYGYTTDPNSPYYVSPAATAMWYPEGHKYNFANKGESQYRIDLADLAVFLDEAPWLWIACWRAEELVQMMFAGGEGMLLGGFEAQTEKATLEHIGDLVNTIGRLEILWLTDPDIQQEIDAADWQRFMEAIYNDLFNVYVATFQFE